jgi:uncharacterized membrane protein
MSEIIQESTAEEKKQKSARHLAVDALRGLIIIFMALDHANLFIAQKHSPGEYWGGGFPVYYDPIAFLTRFVTHLSAPGFFFLMGVGMLLFANSRRKHGWSEWQIVRHFWIRGALLMALQLLLINRAWETAPLGWGIQIYIGVLFALGGSMIVGSLLLWLKPVHLLGLAAVLLVGTQLLVPEATLWGKTEFISALDYLNPTLIYPGGTAQFWANYPILPWLGLVFFGIVFGYWLVENPERVYVWVIRIGGAFLLGFLVVRSLDGFGNIRPRMGYSVIDYLNVVKYPPSIAFTFLTMGLNLLLLGVFARAKEWMLKFQELLAVFGRAPLFFYIIHLFAYSALGRWLTPNGTSIPAMYPYWLFGLLMLFPLTLWFGVYKRRQPVNSVLRFL